MYIIIAIIMFGVLIGVHEFGHFSAAKLCGVRVNEFAIGMGPVLWKKKKGDTQYSLRLFSHRRLLQHGGGRGKLGRSEGVYQ